ncbi:MAG TPA: hypothetical protein VNB06_11285 [Thermoanaerobaculia bacterium]|nr:hypothetical protein [Thermoanaerobaculia bacterium]
MAASCGSVEEPRRTVEVQPPPIVWISLDGLRADVVEELGGLPGLTPNLDRFLASAEVAGSAIAASTDPIAAAMSAFTGLLPSQHGALHRETPALADARETLAEALAGGGYRTIAFVGGTRVSAAHGHAAGFEEWRGLGPGREALRFLRQLADEPTFVWIDLDLPGPPLRHYPALVPRLEALGDRVAAEGLPERVGTVELADAVRGSQVLSDEVRRRWFSLYCLNVARADLRLGELLDALAASPAGARAVVAVVSARGEEVGDQPEGEPSGALRRRWLEVPLGLRLGGSLRAAAEARNPGLLAVARLHASLVEAAGGVALPGTATSFWSSVDGALSERWTPSGELELSWTSSVGDGEVDQVVVDDGFGLDAAPSEPRREVGWRWLPSAERLLSEQEVAPLERELRERWQSLIGDSPPRKPRWLEVTAGTQSHE